MVVGDVGDDVVVDYCGYGGVVVGGVGVVVGLVVGCCVHVGFVVECVLGVVDICIAGACCVCWWCWCCRWCCRWCRCRV